MTKLLAKDGEGERLDRFELITELASGGMATVYLARLSGVAGFQRLVAIKRLHPHLAREPEFVEMFLDEARLAARIHHPNVVPIQEVGESDSGYYLVMDYVEGDTFARVLARASQAKTTVPHGVTIRVLLDVLAGLHAAHELKDDHGAPLEIVHRDVSPQNILVGADGVARLVDFGVARAASRLSTTRSGQLKGKLAYMAPEQARGKGVDRRADIFSCGIVLWEALALKRLFKGDGEAETLNRVLYDDIPPPSSVKPDLPKSLEDVCMKALHRDIEQRYATAQDFADELENAAKALSCVGSVRDVAATLDQVLGSDLSQQREAVRAWLSRSEPTGPRSKPDLSQPPKESVVTRVEGGTKSEPSSARGERRSFTPSPPSTSRPQIDRHAVTAPAPPDMGSSPGGDKVSSVSSAVLQMPDVSSVNAATSLQPARSRKGRVAIVLAAAAVVLVASAWGAKTYVSGGARTSAGPAPPASTAAAPKAVTATPSAVPEEKAGDKPADTSTAATASASSSATVAASAHAKPPVVPGKPGAGGRPVGPVKPPGNVPDDMSKNPYR